MNRYPVLATLLLWLIAFATTLTVAATGGEAGHVAPLWAVCMIGNVVAVRRSQA